MTNEEAIKILKSKMDGSVDTSYEWAETVRLAIKALEQPEVIRCKDCKYYDPNDHCFLQGAEADDFCSYAERREDG